MNTVYLKTKRKNRKRHVKKIGLFFIGVGILLFLYFLFPVLSYQIFLARAFSDDIEVPVPKYMVARGENNIGSLVSQGLSQITTNYNDARNWYHGTNLEQLKDKIPQPVEVKKNPDFYLLSIPKLKIENAVVSTTDYDLTKHLVQYLGTAIPGEKGTAVIFGHSTIPAWFDPKNYKAIFATLHTIKVGDEINTVVNGIPYKYKVFSILYLHE